MEKKKLTPKENTLKKDLKAETKWLKQGLKEIERFTTMPDEEYKTKGLALAVHGVYLAYNRMQDILSKYSKD